MKVSLLSAALILVAASFFGWQGHARLVDARESHGRLVAEAEAMGLDASGIANGADGKVAQTKTRRDDPGDKAAVVKAFSTKLVAFAKEMEAMQKEGKQPDEDMQKRMFEVLEVMLSLDAAQLKLLVAEIRGTTDLSDEMRTGILGFAVMMLANDHPAAALAIFTESGDLMKETGSSQHVISSAVARLAQEDPMAALDWIRKNSKEHPELVTDQTKRGVLAGAARQDPKLAFSLIAELGFKDGSRAVGSIVETATSTEQRKAVLAAMRDHAKTLGPEAAAAITEETLKELGQGLSRQGHDGTVAWLKESGLSPEETADFAEGVQPWQTKSETGKWIGWLAENVPGDKMESRVTLFMNQWARDDYKAAGLWLNDFKDGPAKDAAVKSYADTVAPYEPASAAEWALTLPEGAERKNLLTNIYGQWKEKDAEAAAEFARQNGITE